MIAFDLVCSRGHKFECWFRSNDSYEEQKNQGILMCPVCNDPHVEKAISSFAIRKYQGRTAPETQAQKTDPKIDAYAVLKALSDYVDKNFEDVGLNFTREALKIHYGEAEKRNIKGMTLPNEEKILEDEGVPFLKVPVLKKLDN